MKLKYPDCDFHGYATKANLTCRDKRVIMPDAFKDQDGEKSTALLGASAQQCRECSWACLSRKPSRWRICLWLFQ